MTVPMIEVLIRHVESDLELAKIEIENISEHLDGSADYAIRFGVEKIRSVGIHQRGIFAFPHKQFNVLALLLQALNSLDPRDLELEGDLDAAKRNPRRRALPWQHKRGHW